MFWKIIFIMSHETLSWVKQKSIGGALCYNHRSQESIYSRGYTIRDLHRREKSIRLLPGCIWDDIG